MRDFNLKYSHQDNEHLRKKLDQEFFVLYDKHASNLYRKICMWINDKMLAQDVLFKSFMEIHRQFLEGAIEKRNSLTSMVNITRTICYNKIAELDHKNEKRSLHG